MAPTGDEQDVFSGVRAFIRVQLVELVVPSLAVAAARGGEILWEEGFGWADREARIPATEHTMYSLASISKPITATGLMVLKDRGQLELDRPIDDYLGEARLVARVGDAAAATVRRVANHTSGLPLHYHFFPADERDRPPPMAETIRRYGNLVTAPGERYQYSNLGYGLLGHLLARRSGKCYADFLREEVFLPLGMTRASVHVGTGLEPYQAARYGPDGARLPFYDFDHPGASAVFCSAHDLVRFGLFHLQAHLPDQKPICTDETLAAMQRPTARRDGTAGYGIGWVVDEDQLGYRTVGHGGGMGGVRTLLTLVPAERLAIAALANCTTELPVRVTEEILAALLPPYAERRARLQAQHQQAQPNVERPRPGCHPAPEWIGAWGGHAHTYQGGLPFRLEVKADGDVHARLGTQLEALVNDVRLNEGRLTGRMVGDIGTPDANRRPCHLHLDLRLRGAVLNGAVVALSPPEVRLGNALSHWAELKKLD